MRRLFIRPFLLVLSMAILSTKISFAVPEEEVIFPEVIAVEGEKSILESFKEDFLYRDPDDRTYIQRIHNDAYYHLVGFSAIGDVVQLHDGSKWEVASSAQQRVLGWVQMDDIFIKPSASWFSYYQYVLHNRTQNQVAEVNLIEPPSNAFQIVNIEPYHRLVHLSDNTIWQIDATDKHFQHWRIGHRVIIGVNNRWRVALFPNAIINVDINNIPYNRIPYSQGNFYGYPAVY